MYSPQISDEVNVGEAATLSYLLVESQAFQGQQNATAQLYANGKQTSPVVITLVARDANGEVVNLPSSAKIELIPYASHSGKWSTLNQPSDFRDFEEFSASESKPSPSDKSSTQKTNPYITTLPNETSAQPFHRYIRNDNNPNDSRTDRFAVKVTWTTSGGTREFRTNHADAPYGGEGAGGRFNSSFYLRSVSPARYSVTQSEPEQKFRGTIDGFTATVKVYSAQLRSSANNRLIEFHSSSSITADSSYEGNKATALGGPGSNIYQKSLPGTPSRLVSVMNQAFSNIDKPGTREITVALGIWARVSERFTARQSSYYKGAVDVYGNSVALKIFLSSNPTDEGRDWESLYTFRIEAE